MSFSGRVLLGLGLGIAAGLFLGEAAAPLDVVAKAYVRLLQMTVLPYMVLSITANLGALTYSEVRRMGVRAGAVMLVIWLTALVFACLMPLAFPNIESAAFYSPALAERADPFNFIDLYIPANPFQSLANSVVPAVVLFSVFVGLALIGVEKKQPLLDVLNSATHALRRIAKFIVGLTPFGIFAIAGHTAGTIDLESVQRIEVYLVAYVAFTLLFALWVLPGLVAALTTIGARESLSESTNALLTAFVVGDLFIVLPALMESCSTLIRRRLDPSGPTGDIPSSIIPMSFTFPHAGKLLSISFILFAGWFSDSVVPVLKYPQLVLSGFFAFFGSLNAAVPFLLDLFRIPADTFELFLATSVVAAHFGTLVAATHTLAVGLLGSAAIAGRLRVQPAKVVRFVVVTIVLTAATIGGLRTGFSTMLITHVDGRSLVNSLQPLATAPVDNHLVIPPSAVSFDSIPRDDHMLEDIRARRVLRVGLIDDGIPYEYRNDRNQVVGFDIEMAQSLAADLDVTAQFVRFAQGELAEQVQARRVDIVMTGARVTPERAAEFATSEPYLEETLAIVTLDHRRGDFRSWKAIHDMGPVRLGVQNLPYYVGTVRRLVPDAQLVVIPETRELIDPSAPYDAYVLPAERGSVLTMLNPRFSVVIPEGATIRMPLAYPIAGRDQSWIRFVNTWIGLKKNEGFVDNLYAHWILGRAAERKQPRWSIMRNVLNWKA
jgi:Na+/H+-dicarboxylate symporter/ABC-type amino acid transport substrate-binding protein